jgi:hypothetical protein
MTVSIHDHRVRELTIQGKGRTIRLFTAYPAVTGPERAEALFEGVKAYAFDGDALSTIIFDAESFSARPDAPEHEQLTGRSRSAAVNPAGLRLKHRTLPSPRL